MRLVYEVLRNIRSQYVGVNSVTIIVTFVRARNLPFKGGIYFIALVIYGLEFEITRIIIRLAADILGVTSISPGLLHLLFSVISSLLRTAFHPALRLFGDFTRYSISSSRLKFRQLLQRLVAIQRLEMLGLPRGNIFICMDYLAPRSALIDLSNFITRICQG